MKTSQPEQDVLLHQKEAGEYAGIPQGSLRAWRHIGKGPKSFKLGGRVTYRKSDLDAWIKAEYERSVRGDEVVAS